MEKNMRCLFGIFILVLFFMVNVFASPDKKMKDDESCPQFHFSLNTPRISGQSTLVYYEGEYHLFYRDFNFEKENKNILWKHSVSRDLIYWEPSLLAAVSGERIGTENDCIQFSGSIIVDKNNLTGLKKGAFPTFLCFYTDNKFCQRMAYSNDKGCTWAKYESNPLIPYNSEEKYENPNVFWYNKGAKYIMLISRKQGETENLKGVFIYSSADLFHWKFESHLSLDVENPNLFCLPVNDQKNEYRWIMTGYGSYYFVGQFDGNKFTPESIQKSMDYGLDYFSPQICNGIHETDGRTIQIGWINGGRDPQALYNSQMAFPCELSMKKDSDGMLLIRKPLSELSILHMKERTFENKDLIPGLNKNILNGIKGDCLHIKGVFEIKTANTFGIFIKYSAKVEKKGIDINYNVKKEVISCLGKTVKLLPEDGKIKLEILIDRTSVEVFCNGGKVVITKGMAPDPESKGLYLYNTGGELFVDNLQVYTLRSVYDKKK